MQSKFDMQSLCINILKSISASQRLLHNWGKNLQNKIVAFMEALTFFEGEMHFKISPSLVKSILDGWIGLSTDGF